MDSSKNYLALSEKLRKSDSPYYVAVVPINRNGRVLLGKRREDGIWTTPAGGANPNETPEDCAVREAWEEAQLPVYKDKLELIGVKTAPDGKPVHCYLYRSPIADTSTAGDPDREAPQWMWLPAHELPREMSNKKNQNRLETVNEAFMKFYGLKKSEGDSEFNHALALAKEGRTEDFLSYIQSIKDRLPKLAANLYDAYYPGAEHAQDTKLAGSPSLEKSGELEQKAIYKWTVDPETQHETIEDLTDERISQLIAKLNKGGEGSRGGRIIGRTKTGKPIYAKKMVHEYTPDKFSADEHREAASHHEKEWTSAKDEKDREHHKKKWAGHRDRAQMIENRSKRMRKSVTQMGGAMGDPDIDTGSYAKELESAMKNEWLEKLYQAMENYSYGDVPETFELDKGTLYLSKVDDGMYSGFFRKREEISGEGEVEDNARVRIERQTLPTLVNFLMAKEWIRAAAEEPVAEPIIEEPQYDERAALAAKLEEIEDQVDSIDVVDNDLRKLELIAKLLGKA